MTNVRGQSLGWNMVALIYKKFNEEQLLLETFSPKMHIERDVCKKLIFKFSNYRWGQWGFNMWFGT